MPTIDQLHDMVKDELDRTENTGMFKQVISDGLQAVRPRERSWTMLTKLPLKLLPLGLASASGWRYAPQE
jgi:hypothetical protein